MAAVAALPRPESPSGHAAPRSHDEEQDEARRRKRLLDGNGARTEKAIVDGRARLGGEPMIDRIARVLFFLGVAALLVLAGITIGWYRVPPATSLDKGVEALRDWRKNWKSYVGTEPTKFLRPSRYPGEGVVVNEPGRAQPGVTLMTGIWDGLPGLSLRALDGKELHRWPAAYSRIWPDPPHLRRDEIPLNDWDTHLHGAVLYEQGDVVFNFEYQGLARLDRCGEVLWRVPKRTHHAVAPAEDGTLWVPSIVQNHEEASKRFLGLAPPFSEDSVIQVSAEDGRVLREISILDVIYKSRYEGVLFGNGLTVPRLVADDPLHLNHVEALGPSMAAAFPMFAAGDILVSLRNVNLLLVIDGKTERVKWSATGPWVRQHEPHFRPDGRISVFDNRWLTSSKDDDTGGAGQASRLVAIDPKTGQVEMLYEGTPAQPFYTGQMGKHQYLPNGNILISEVTAGRAFEIDPAGKIVWSFVSRFDEDRVSVLEQATRYPESFAGFVGGSCPADTPTAGLGQRRAGEVASAAAHAADER
jgi:hypothetical protein